MAYFFSDGIILLRCYIHGHETKRNANKKMNMDTANLTFRQLMGNGMRYRVPPFQRDYSWTETEWEDLWVDIEGMFEEDGEPAHYMGYLVLQSSDDRQYNIIDGQQRLTTISIMVLAGLSVLKELVHSDHDGPNNQKRLEQLRNSYIGYLDPVSLVASSKLELNRHNNSFYQNYMVPLEPLPQRGLKSSEHLLRKAFIWFTDRIKTRVGSTDKSGVELAKFFDGLVDKLIFTRITVTDELNAFKVFETLNARGVRLSATDLLKNYLFSIIAARKPHETELHETELKQLEERWEKIVALLGSESFPVFLRVFWNSRHKLVRKSDLFKTIRQNIDNRESAYTLVRDLERSAAVYAALREPQDESWNPDEKKTLKQLEMFHVRQPFAMLLASYERFYASEPTVFLRILKGIATISFRYNVICNLQPQEQERLYNAIARKISSGEYTSAPDVIGALKDVYPDDARFKAAFAEKEFRTASRNKKIVRYIFFEIERQQSGADLDVESSMYSLEHIIPENPGEQWAYIEENRQDKLIYRLGNITPLERGRNKVLGNDGYEAKREVFSNSTFKITRAIAENYDSWDENKVESRQKQLAIVACGIWKIDFGK
jgi:uncharacterized protein with ParB-like and HNH nuclease domain